MNIEIPTSCPSCGSPLEKVGPQLYCTNKSTCPAQNKKMVETFCKNMKIKGFGPKTIDKLELQAINDIYEIDNVQLINVLGQATGEKLYEQIQNSKNTTFAQLLGSLSIPRIGLGTARKIATKYNSLEELQDNLDNPELSPSVRESLERWFKHSYPMLEEVLNDFNFEVVKQTPKPSTGKTVCITGKLSLYTKAQATEELQSLGFDVKSTVSKNTDLLICDYQKGSSKEQKAKELNIPIIKFTEIYNYV